MKPLPHVVLLVGLVTASRLLGADASAPTPTNEAPSAPVTAIQSSTPAQPAAALTAAAPAASNTAPAAALAPETKAAAAAPAEPPGTNTVAVSPPSAPAVTVENGTNGLRLNFHNAPLNLVLDYLSDAAGFVINKETDVRGTVDVQGKDLTKDEAVEVLNAALKKNGYAVIRNNRILTIVSQDGSQKRDLPVEVGNNPEEVERSNEVVTQIIPVKYASVAQLVANLEMLLPSTATLSANESANSMILTATKTDIKRMLKIITALDTSIASVSNIRVIPLQYADAKDTATLISTLFSSQGTQGSSSSRGSLFSMFGGGGPFGGPPGGPGGFFGGRDRSSSRSGSSSGGNAAAAHVTAVGDDRSNSVVVSAPADLLATIESMIKEIDQEVTDVTELRVFRLVNADPSETADQLAMLFPDTTGTGSSSQGSTTPFFFRGFSSRRSSSSSTASNSDRAKKLGRVLAVPDPRTSSIIVMASKTLMPQIADMIAELDSNKGRKEVVGFYDLQNADPAEIYVNLQELFQRNNVRQQNNSQSTLLGQNNPLNQRLRNSANSSSSGSTSIGGGRSGGIGGGSAFGGGGF